MTTCETEGRERLSKGLKQGLELVQLSTKAREDGGMH